MSPKKHVPLSGSERSFPVFWLLIAGENVSELAEIAQSRSVVGAFHDIRHLAR